MLLVNHGSRFVRKRRLVYFGQCYFFFYHLFVFFFFFWTLRPGILFDITGAYIWALKRWSSADTAAGKRDGIIMLFRYRYIFSPRARRSLNNNTRIIHLSAVDLSYRNRFNSFAPLPLSLMKYPTAERYNIIRIRWGGAVRSGFGHSPGRWCEGIGVTHVVHVRARVKDINKRKTLIF